jgi:hypothetical protein
MQSKSSAEVGMVAKPKSKKHNRSRKNKTRRSEHAALRPENALRFFKTLHPVLTKFMKKHPELQKSINYYKGAGYSKMNQVLNFKKYTMETFGVKTYLEKHDLQKSPFKESYDAAYQLYEENPKDLFSALKANIIYNVYEIMNLRRAFKLFKAPSTYSLPTLFRGLSIADPTKQPFHGISVGQTITMNSFQSCSLSIETAISFQTCSSNGPCCLFVLNVQPAVKFLPLFWSSSESYNSSEHEVVLEPFTQFQLNEKRTERLPIEVARKCGYNRFNADGTLTIDVYYITVKPPASDADNEFNAIIDKMKNNVEDAMQGMTIDVDLGKDSFF